MKLIALCVHEFSLRNKIIEVWHRKNWRTKCRVWLCGMLWMCAHLKLATYNKSDESLHSNQHFSVVIWLFASTPSTTTHRALGGIMRFVELFKLLYCQQQQLHKYFGSYTATYIHVYMYVYVVAYHSPLTCASHRTKNPQKFIQFMSNMRRHQLSALASSEKIRPVAGGQSAERVTYQSKQNNQKIVDGWLVEPMQHGRAHRQGSIQTKIHIDAQEFRQK